MPVRIPSISAAPLSRALLNAGRQSGLRRHTTRLFSATARAEVVKPFLLADIGEGEGFFVLLSSYGWLLRVSSKYTDSHRYQRM